MPGVCDLLDEFVNRESRNDRVHTNPILSSFDRSAARERMDSCLRCSVSSLSASTRCASCCATPLTTCTDEQPCVFAMVKEGVEDLDLSGFAFMNWVGGGGSLGSMRSAADHT